MIIVCALISLFLQWDVQAEETRMPKYDPDVKFKNISNYHDFAQLLLDHERVKQEAYNFAKSRGWIRFPLKMKKELTELNYTAYPFLDELLKFHPDQREDERKQKQYYYLNERRVGDRRALRQFKLRYNRMKYSILPTEAGRTKKRKNDMSEEIRNPVKYMKEKLLRMDDAIDYIDVQALKERMTTPEDFAEMKNRAELIRKRIHAIENNGTEKYTPRPPITLRTTRVTVRPLKGSRLKILRQMFPQYFVDVNMTTPNSLERNTKMSKSSEENK